MDDIERPARLAKACFDEAVAQLEMAVYLMAEAGDRPMAKKIQNVADQVRANKTRLLP